MLFFITLFPFITNAQNIPTQTVRGIIEEGNLGITLPGVHVIWLGDSSKSTGVVSDENGEFLFKNLPVGIHSFEFSMMGYQKIIKRNIEVTSAKEVILKINMEEEVEMMDDVEIVIEESAISDPFSILSGISIPMEDSKYATGGRGEPQRIIQNYPGVQGADDSRNDLVIRGNSPFGVIYLLEGIPLPNLNHFSIPGSTGGPVSVLNKNTLGNSGFYTGAFPASYGNSTAGIFDLNLRNGNNNQSEFTGQLGFLGTELFAEGPFKNKKSSYIASYRYSTLGLFSSLGINIGTDAIPKYQDGSFKINLKSTKNNKFNLALFGIGGSSNISIKISGKTIDDIYDDPSTYSEIDRDQDFGTSMGAVGLTSRWLINQTSTLHTTIGTSFSKQGALHYLCEIDPGNSKFILSDPSRPVVDYTFITRKNSAAINYMSQKNSKSLFNAGVLMEFNHYNFMDSTLTVIDKNDPAYGDYTIRWNTKESAALFQGFMQWKVNFSPKLKTVFGVHSQYYTLNNSKSLLEPRFGLSYNTSKNRTLSLGLGLHTQTLPEYTYFYKGIEDVPYNKNLDFMRSSHFVAGYETKIKSNYRIKSEIYYQYLDHIPIIDKPGSSYSLLNTGSGFSRLFPDTLSNIGIGRNYGVEFTLERLSSNDHFFLFTTSLYNSKYKGGDQVWRDTEFNGNYMANILYGKQFNVKNRHLLYLGTKFTVAGGKRYGEVDMQKSYELREIVYMDATRNELRFKNYMRFDLNINYRINGNKLAHEIGLDLINITNRNNLLKLTYIPPVDVSIDPLGETREESQLGFLPIFYYKIDF